MLPTLDAALSLQGAIKTYLLWLQQWHVEILWSSHQDASSLVQDALLEVASTQGSGTAMEQSPLFASQPSSTKQETLSSKRTPKPLAVYPELPDPAPWKGEEGLARLRDIVGPCTRCKLCEGRNQLVFGEGDPKATLMFVGEGPGAEEDRTGLPFVGAAGTLLNRMIEAMGLRREQTYIGNVVKCRPPGNRVPEPDEVFQCGPFLRAQIQMVRPRIIVALGKTPTQFLLQTAAPMNKLRGQFADYEGTPVMPTYHPAYLLRNPAAKREVWEDLQKVMAALKVK